ncbi:Protein NRT1/ PTR FAMILY 1.2 like [Actinidia chinensis var. chinensis]|uniref:Protein NRT1/ PTR FAMILY 1.2 like n=1 Tax=Actinidia chinensis var. chinensis TaxID=1590841 RepID=A0A2R6Q2W7_ACTCC|nr:Protein NRT1/ PTR FAMILY 1.2 like [Actinidia chinensis var. chinensis]
MTILAIMKLLLPSESLRWLNKACITKDAERDLNPDGSPSNPGVICTVDQVNSVKAFLRVIPMWSTAIMFSICTNQLSFSTLQANTMNDTFEIPAGSFIVFMIFTAMVWVAFYDRVLLLLLARHTGSPNGLSSKVRMGIGLLLACVATAMAAIIESIRRGRAIDEGLENNPCGVVKLSAMWLVPQYTLLGLAEAFNPPVQIEFCYSQFPKSMSSIPMALFELAMAMSSLVGSLLVNIVDGAATKGVQEWMSRVFS